MADQSKLATFREGNASNGMKQWDVSLGDPMVQVVDDDLFLRTAFGWPQAGAGGKECSKSEKTLTIGRDTHVMNCKASKIIRFQYLKS